MGYTRARDLLPEHLLREVQKYAEGEYLYIPRKEGSREIWGARGARDIIKNRNREIRTKHAAGRTVPELAETYFLSQKTIYHILKKQD